jgi:hypothetical protein
VRKRLKIKPWLSLALLAAAIFAGAAALDFYGHRFVRSDRDMFRFLPQRAASVFYVNVEALRHSGILRLLSGAAPVKDADYVTFLHDTHFDYTRDVSAVAGAADRKSLFFLVRGRFDWSKLRAYAQSHSGNCKNQICEAPASKAGRWASFVSIQSDVLALALSEDRWAVQEIRTTKATIEGPIPQEPVWLKVSQRLISDPASLPLPLRIFAIALQSADPVVLSLGPAEIEAHAQFQLHMYAQCATRATAQSISSQLEIDTKMLKLELAREYAKPNAADLTGLLAGGTFQAIDKQVIGTWPVHRELLKSFE